MLCLRIPAVPLLFPEQPVSEIHNPMIVLWIRCAAAIPVASISSELVLLSSFATRPSALSSLATSELVRHLSSFATRPSALRSFATPVIPAGSIVYWKKKSVDDAWRSL